GHTELRDDWSKEMQSFMTCIEAEPLLKSLNENVPFKLGPFSPMPDHVRDYLLQRLRGELREFQLANDADPDTVAAKTQFVLDFAGDHTLKQWEPELLSFIREQEGQFLINKLTELDSVGYKYNLEFNHASET